MTPSSSFLWDVVVITKLAAIATIIVIVIITYCYLNKNHHFRILLSFYSIPLL